MRQMIRNLAPEDRIPSRSGLVSAGFVVDIRDPLAGGHLSFHMLAERDIVVTGLPVRHPDIVCSELLREPRLRAVAESHPLAQADGGFRERAPAVAQAGSLLA